VFENGGKGNNDEANEGFEHATVVTVVSIAVVGPLLPSPPGGLLLSFGRSLGAAAQIVEQVRHLAHHVELLHAGFLISAALFHLYRNRGVAETGDTAGVPAGERGGVGHQAGEQQH